VKILLDECVPTRLAELLSGHQVSRVTKIGWTGIANGELLRKASSEMDACSYPLNHWDGLTLYLNYGNVPISNIKIEHQIRNLKLGAKNWLFAASEVGAHTIAVMNSLVCTCKMNGINTLDYFTDILGRLDSDTPKNLTPLKWAKDKGIIDS